RSQSVRRHPTQPLLIAANRWHLRDDGPDPAVGRGEDEHVAAGIAGAPDADPVRIDLGQGFEKRDGSPPVSDLAPRVDIVTDGAVASSEVPVIMHEHHEPGPCKGQSEAL